MFLPLTKWFLRKHPLSRALSPPERLMLRSPSHPSHRSQRHWKSPRWSRHFWPWPKNEHSDPVQRETNSQHKLHCGKKHGVSLRTPWACAETGCSPSPPAAIPLPTASHTCPITKASAFFFSFFLRVFYIATVLSLCLQLVLDSERAMWRRVSWWVQTISSDDWANQRGKNSPADSFSKMHFKMHFILKKKN